MAGILFSVPALASQNRTILTNWYVSVGGSSYFGLANFNHNNNYLFGTFIAFIEGEAIVNEFRSLENFEAFSLS